MKTIEIKTQSELQDYKDSKEVCNLDMKKWEGGNIDLEGATTGNIYLEDATTRNIYLRDATTRKIYLDDATIGDIDLDGATIGHIYLECATIGNIDLRGATIGHILLRDATYDKIIQNYAKEDKKFLKSLPLDIIRLSQWQSNENWKNCTTKKELHTCGTTYCVRGYAEAKYFVENGKQVEDVNTLFPNLKHLFYMTDDQFLKEREYILNN